MQLSPTAVLPEVLARIGGRRGAPVHISDDELQRWPPIAVAALKSAGLLKPASPATNAVCSGCERGCFMPVEVLASNPAYPLDLPTAFLVCDKRPDINRVAVPINQLVQWRTGGQLLGDTLAQMLDLQRGAVATNAGQHWSIGVVQGLQHRAPLVLHAGALEGPQLALAGHVVLVAEVLTFKKSALALDVAALVRLVDSPTGQEAAEAESPDARQKRLAARVTELKVHGVKAFLELAATEEGITKSRLQQILKRQPKAKDAFGAMAESLAGPLSKGKAKS